MSASKSPNSVNRKNVAAILKDDRNAKKALELKVKSIVVNIIESQKAHSSYFAKKRSDEAKTVFSCFVNILSSQIN